MARPTAGLPYIVDGDFRKRCQGYENAGHGGGRRAGLCGEAAGEVGQVATVWEHQHEVVQGQLQLWLDYVPENEEQGRVQGNFVEHFVGWRKEIEDRLTELARKEQSERVRLASVQAGDAVLQTVTVPLSEVRANPEEWKPAFEYEYNVLVRDTSAVRPVPRASLPHNTELVPGKMVCVRKGGTGAKRARAVICGNMATPGADPPPENSPGGAYASGANGTLIRAAIRQAAHQEWRVSSLDVKSAFLQAPRPVPENARPVAVEPPRIMVQLGVAAADEVWLIDKAPYGFTSSPARWAVHRDSVLASIRWQQQQDEFFLEVTRERNLWRVMKQGCAQPQGLLLVYVDDLLVLSGEEVRQALIREIQSHWQTSVPEEVNHQQWVRFCGYEMKRFEDQIMLGQPSYLRDLIKRRQVTGKRSSRMAKDMMPPEEPEQDVTVAHIREAQSIAGEILWIALRSRPDLSYAVSMLGRQVTKNPRWAVALGEQILEYLNDPQALPVLWTLQAGRSRT